MAKIELTYKQIKNLGLWDKVCEFKGWDDYNADEAFSGNELIEFDDEFKKESQWEIEYKNSMEELTAEYKEAYELAGGDNYLQGKKYLLFDAANKGLKYEMVVREMEEYLDERRDIEALSELQEILSRGLNYDFPEDY